VTVDGWVVIAVLMLMAAISWLVMASKAFVIKKVGADDREFLHAYHKLAPAQTDALDQNEDEVSIEMDDSDLLTAVSASRSTTGIHRCSGFITAAYMN